LTTTTKLAIIGVLIGIVCAIGLVFFAIKMSETSVTSNQDGIPADVNIPYYEKIPYDMLRAAPAGTVVRVRNDYGWDTITKLRTAYIIDKNDAPGLLIPADQF